MKIHYCALIFSFGLILFSCRQQQDFQNQVANMSKHDVGGLYDVRAIIIDTGDFVYHIPTFQSKISKLD